MRRSVIICIGAAVGVLLLAVLLQRIDGGTERPRYHQHLEQPSEEDLGPCALCGGDASLCTHLPIINIQTGGQKIPGRPVADSLGSVAYYETGDNGEEEILINFSTVSTEGVWHHPDDPPTLEGEAMFRIRGNSSRWFDKSSYRLRLVDNSNPEKEISQSLLGMNPGEEWALHGPFLDKTLIRNYMWMNLSAEIMGYAPDARFCEVTLDGEYQGVYVLMELISVADGRVELTKYQDGDPACSYLVRMEHRTNPEKRLDNFTFYTGRLEAGRQVELLYPPRSRLTQQIKDYVQTDINEIEKLLYCMEMSSGSDTWKKDIDMNSFVNYYILVEFLAINDTFSNSTYFHRDLRGKLRAGPMWDFNNALDNFFVSLADDEFILSQRSWFGQLTQDEDFVEQVIRRYRSLRQGPLSEERLLAYVEETGDWLGSAVSRNFAVWGHSFDPNQLIRQARRQPNKNIGQTLEDVNPSSYEQAVSWMVDYMTDRGRWLDAHIDALRQNCHPSKNANQILG